MRFSAVTTAGAPWGARAPRPVAALCHALAAGVTDHLAGGVTALPAWFGTTARNWSGETVSGASPTLPALLEAWGEPAAAQ
jgi:hypothetical protein